MRTVLAALGLMTSVSAAAQLTEAQCSVANPGTNEQRIADCIEAKIPTNCDGHSGGSVYRATCSWGEVEVVERRIARAEKVIRGKLSKVKTDTSALEQLEAAQKQWMTFRDRHCRFSDTVANPRHTLDNHDMQYVSCVRKLSEQRALELESLGKRLR